ncbi:MAG: hypothetical protein GDA42_11600 [Ekhidna sp.]|nr:hypothetical protein [Ekhidna sp.]
MKKLNKYLLIMFVTFIIASCDDAGGIDDEIFAIRENAPLAVWVKGKSAEGSDSLRLSDPTSAVAYEIELIDASDGSSANRFTMTVSYTSKKVTTKKTLISQSSFSTNSNDNKGFSGSFSLTDIASALEMEISSFSEGDKFSFSNTVTSNSENYRNGNSNTFSNSLKDFDLKIPIETVKLTSFKSNKKFLKANSKNTVTLAFANDLTIKLKTLPTVERTSAEGNTDDTIGPATAVKDKKGSDSVYTFVYTPGAADVDTISFTITDASAVTATGFAMKDSLFKSVFIIDNIVPEVISEADIIETNTDSDTTGIRFVRIFNEDIGKIDMTANIIRKDDDSDGMVDEDGEVSKLSPKFNLRTLDFTYPWTGTSVGPVEITIKMEDMAGNVLNLGTATFLVP